MVKRLLVIVSAVMALCLGWGGFLLWQQKAERERFFLPVGHGAALAREYTPGWVVAPGFVEPVTKELRLGFDMSGVIHGMLVKEGDMVKAGQPLAYLRQDEYKAALEEARSRLAEARADMEMHLSGARQEERDKAAAELERAKARNEQAQRENIHRQQQKGRGAFGIEDVQRAERDAIIATHELVIAQEQFDMTQQFYRVEEIEMARQRLNAALGNFAQAEAVLDKTFLRSPVNGKVLRIFSDPGEAYSIFAPMPVLSVGDVSTLNVRAEVDERDVARVKTGQKAFVAADAFGSARHAGAVSRMELSMTPKKTRTGDPSEPVDRSVLEVLVTLDEPGPFFSGMRVDVYIEGEPPLDPVAAAVDRDL